MQLKTRQDKDKRSTVVTPNRSSLKKGNQTPTPFPLSWFQNCLLLDTYTVFLCLTLHHMTSLLRMGQTADTPSLINKRAHSDYLYLSVLLRVLHYILWTDSDRTDSLASFQGRACTLGYSVPAITAGIQRNIKKNYTQLYAVPNGLHFPQPELRHKVCKWVINEENRKRRLGSSGNHPVMKAIT